MGSQIDILVPISSGTVTARIDEHQLLHDVFNIYVLDVASDLIPEMMCDQHIRRASVEYPQILSTGRHLRDWNWKGRDGARVPPLRPRYASHPSVAWVVDQLANYIFLYDLMCQVWLEYKYRFGGSPATLSKYQQLLGVGVPSGISGFSTTSTVPTSPPQTLPDMFRILRTIEHFRSWGSAVAAYRDYYITDVWSYATWTRRSPPEWYARGLQEYEDDREALMVWRDSRFDFEPNEIPF